jgi:hypothetical protein
MRVVGTSFGLRRSGQLPSVATLAAKLQSLNNDANPGPPQLDQPHADSAPLGLVETMFHLFHSHVSHVGGNPPDVPDRIPDTSVAFTVEGNVLDLLY